MKDHDNVTATMMTFNSLRLGGLKTVSPFWYFLINIAQKGCLNPIIKNLNNVLFIYFCVSLVIYFLVSKNKPTLLNFRKMKFLCNTAFSLLCSKRAAFSLSYLTDQTSNFVPSTRRRLSRIDSRRLFTHQQSQEWNF